MNPKARRLADWITDIREATQNIKLWALLDSLPDASIKQ